jgi:hypothetical protein
MDIHEHLKKQIDISKTGHGIKKGSGIHQIQEGTEFEQKEEIPKVGNDRGKTRNSVEA